MPKPASLLRHMDQCVSRIEAEMARQLADLERKLRPQLTEHARATLRRWPDAVSFTLGESGPFFTLKDGTTVTADQTRSGGPTLPDDVSDLLQFAQTYAERFVYDPVHLIK